MDIGALALAGFTWILGRESSGRKNRKISTATNFKNRSSIDGGDRDLSGGSSGFCQCSAFSTRCRRSNQNSSDYFADSTKAVTFV